MEGAPHTAKRTIDVSLGCPLPSYIKEGRRRWPARRGRAKGEGSPTRTPLLVGFAPLPSNGEGKGERGEREKERGGGVPPPLVQFELGRGRRTPPLVAFLPLSTMAHEAH